LLSDGEKRLTPWSLGKYKYYLTHMWGKRKNAREEESFAMLEIRWRRRIKENKNTEFTRLGRDVDNKNLDRFAKRHNWERGSSDPLPEIRGTIHHLSLTISTLSLTPAQ
jgi:hypothetical protein